MTKTIKLSLACAAISTSLFSETIILQPLEITSTAIKTDELKSTDAIEVYTKKDIENSKAKDLYEFLNSSTSISTMPSYGNPFVQLLDIRGYGLSNGFQNLVVSIDGRKLNNIDNAPQLLSSMSIDSIEKIEIIKSSGIVTSGDGANAGAINIITKNKNEKSVSFFAGKDKTEGLSLNLSQINENSSVSFMANMKKTDGTRRINAAGEKDQNKDTNVAFKFSISPTDDLELRVSSLVSRLNVIYGGTMSKAQYETDPSAFSGFTSHQKIDTNVLGSGFTYYINDKLSLNADANIENKMSDYVPSYGERNYNYDSAKASLDYVDDSLSVSLGYDVFYGDREENANLTTKNNHAAFLQSVFNFGPNSLKFGYRYEKVEYKHKDNSTNIKQDDDLYGAELGYNLSLGKNRSLFLNYAHAYQAPNIDMFFATTYDPITWAPSTSFNQFIKPMKTDSLTLGYNHISNKYKMKLSLYYTKLKDEIYLYKNALNPFDFGTNTNIDKSHKYGLDFYNHYVISDMFNTSINYNYTQAIIDTEIGNNSENYKDKKLPGVSDHSLKFVFNYLPSSKSLISLSHIFRSEAYAADDFANNFTQKQEVYNSTNLSASHKLEDKLEVFAKINNLFEQKNGLWVKDDAIYPVNFARTAYMGLKLKF